MLDNELAIASLSLGRHVSHSLPEKIISAAEQGFSGVEITYIDLDNYAESQSTSMLNAAQAIRILCLQNQLTILSFAAFENFEGNKSPIAERLQIARTWLDLAHALGAVHLQVPSTYLRDINNDHALMVSELRQLADLAQSYDPVIKIAYENLAWSTKVWRWQDALQVVKDVNASNFGLCLDSFHEAAGLWGDPHAASGIQADGDRRLTESLQELIDYCPLEKIFYLQLSDGAKFDPPYSKTHPWFDPTLEPGHVWSNELRPFPTETELGGYMPVQQIAKAILVDKAFQGWVSLETFDRRMREADEKPNKNAKRGMTAWHNLKKNLLEEVGSKPVADIEARI